MTEQFPTPPFVAILMAVYNGVENLQAQLDSFAAQDHPHWRVLASDDGSTDESRALLDAFTAAGQPLIRLDGPGQGVAENFLSLIRRMPDHVPEGSWMAFSDQDDVWLPDRLSRGLEALAPLPAERPALYCSRTWVTDAALGNRRLSAPRPQPPGFANALVQNIAAGNTILLNPAGAALLRATAAEVPGILMHDWWIYQVISGAGGSVVHDNRPTLLYRQHQANQVGANDSAQAKAKRLWKLLRGDFRAWNTINISALHASAHRLTPENRQLLEGFAARRNGGVSTRLGAVRRLGLYRQSRSSTLALWVSALLRRM